jgi:hypothetical protein
MIEIITLFIFILLQILDVVTTKVCLDNGNTEANIFMSKLMDKMGILPTLILIKSIVIAFACLSVYISVYTVWFLIAMNLFYIWVVLNNFKVLKDTKK